MIRIVVEPSMAEQIRRAEGQVELVDADGNRLGVVRRPPTEEEIQFAKSRVGRTGQKLTMDEVIATLDSL